MKVLLIIVGFKFLIFFQKSIVNWSKIYVTSELHGTDNRDDKLVWSQTEVRNRSPAWIRVR